MLKHTTSQGGIAKAFHLFLACWGALEPLDPPGPAWSTRLGVYLEYIRETFVFGDNIE